MRGVHLGNEQRNIRIHAVISGIAHHRISRTSELFFGCPCDRGIERGEYEVTLERGIEALHDQFAHSLGNGRIEMPADRLGVRFTRGALRSGDFREFKPRVIGKQVHDALANETGCA